MSPTCRLHPEAADPAQRGEHMSAPKFRAALTSLALVGAASLSVIAVSAPAEAATAPVPVSISKKRVVTMPTVVQPGVNTFAVSTKAKQSDLPAAQPGRRLHRRGGRARHREGSRPGQAQAAQAVRGQRHPGRWRGRHGRPPGLAHRHPGARHLLGARRQHQRRRRSSSRSPSAGARHRQRRCRLCVTIKAKGATKWANKPASIPRRVCSPSPTARARTTSSRWSSSRRARRVKDFKKWFLNPEGPSGPPPVDFSKACR